MSDEDEREAFAAMIMGHISTNHPEVELEYNAQLYCLTYKIDGDQGVLNLGNAFSEWQQTPPAEHGELLARYTAWVERSSAQGSQVASDWEQAREHLALSLRPWFYFAKLQLQLRLQGHDQDIASTIPHRRIGPELALTVAYDTPDAILNVTSSHLGDWGISAEEAFAQGRANLLAASPDEGLERIEGTSVYISRWEDNYDASRLVLEELYADLDLAGEPVVMAPHRDVLCVCGRDDLEGLAVMANCGEHYITQPRSLSFHALLPEREFEAFVPAGELGVAFELLTLKERLQQYDAQKQMLEALENDSSWPAVVPEFRAYQSDGGLQTVAAFLEDCDVLLPRVDEVLIVFHDPDREAEAFAWSQLEDALGEDLIARDLWPPRFLVRSASLARLLASTSD